MRKKLDDVRIVDSIGTKWQAHIWIELNRMFVHLEGYGNWYPIDLLRDDKFAFEVNMLLRAKGYQGEHLYPLREGYTDSEIEFEKSPELKKFIVDNWKHLPVDS